jgi:hypothetical protein
MAGESTVMVLEGACAGSGASVSTVIAKCRATGPLDNVHDERVRTVAAQKRRVKLRRARKSYFPR